MPEIRSKIALGITGAGGRMGCALLHEAADDARFEVSGAIGRDGDAAALFDGADLVLDFSAADAAVVHAGLARQTGTALLVGTTGLSEEAVAGLRAAASSAAVLLAPNTSLGIGLLGSFARQAARRLGADFRVEIEDIHHKDKRDAPSGTALMLGRVVAEARNMEMDELSITSRRTGDFAGKHRVSFIGALERIDLIHEAADRRVFALGALDAACWLVRQPAGFYSMTDFLGPARGAEGSEKS